MIKYEYQKSGRYFAQIPEEFKDLATQELKKFGAKDIRPTHRGLYFTASPKSLYTVNYCSAIISKILAPLFSFYCSSEKELYQKSLKFPWMDLLDRNQTFAIDSSVSHSKIHHSKFAALRLKDAIADSFTQKLGVRPSVNTEDPDLWIHLFIHRNRATVSIDTSGSSLHRRGYRLRSVKAPMMETLAAAVVRYAEWDGEKPLYDPLCGSGTILCEAYLYATSTPPGFLRRKFGFEMLPDFDNTLWKNIQNDYKSKIKTLQKGLIYGSDKSIRAVKHSLYNASRILDDHPIEIEQKDIFTIPEIRDSIIITNPPYGIRLGDEEEMEIFYKNLGDFLKQRCSGSTAYIYFGDRKYLKFIGLRPSWKKPLKNGGLDGRLAKFDLY